MQAVDIKYIMNKVKNDEKVSVATDKSCEGF